MEKPDKLTIPHFHEHVNANAMCLRWWKQPPDSWKRIQYPMPLPVFVGMKSSPIDAWAKEQGIKWIYCILYHTPAAREVEWCNPLLKTIVSARGAGTFKNWAEHLAKATWLGNTRGSTNQAGTAWLELLHTVEGGKSHKKCAHKKCVGENSLGYSALRQRQTPLWDCCCSKPQSM